MGLIDNPAAPGQGRWYWRLWERLTRPPLEVEEVGERRQVRLLAGLTLLLALVITGAIFTTLNDESAHVMRALVATAACLFVAYALSRSRWHRAGAFLVVGALSLIAFWRITSGEQNISLNFYAFLPVVFLFSTLFLSKRAAYLAVGLNLIGILTVPYWAANFTFTDILITLGPLFSLGFLLLLAKNYRDNVERDRLGDLTITNHALEQLRVELDQRVQARTQALSQTTAELEATLEATADGILVTGSQGGVLRLNQQLVAMWQIPPEISGAQKDAKILGFVQKQLAEPQKFAEKRAQLASQPESESSELLPCRDGRVFASFSKPLRLGKQVVGRVWGFRDVSERVRSEQQIKEEQLHTREILGSITVPLLISKKADGLVVYANEPLAEMLRLSRSEMIGQPVPDFYQSPADRDAYQNILEEKGFVANFDLRLKRADGERFWGLVSGRSIAFRGDPAMVTTIIDITARQKARADLARRASELKNVADVSTVVAANLEPNELLEQVVNLTKDRFNLYHAHVYLLDESKTQLILTSGAGEIGRRMVAEGRRIPLAQEQSLVARAARTGQGVVINDVQVDTGFLPHPLLPNTRAEMSIPLIAGNEVQGVLDIQQDRPNCFTAEDITIFTTLASQIAVALQNARRYDGLQRALEELTRLQRLMAREGWEAYLATQERPFIGYAFDNHGAKPVGEKRQEMEEPTETDEPAPETAVSLPLTVRGEAIGRLGLHSPDADALPERQQFLLQSIAQQVSEALERARLSEQTQQALAETERRNREMAVINNIVTRISASLDLHHSLQIIVDELVTAVGVDQVRVALLQPGGQELLVVTEHFDQSRSASALGEIIPVVGNELTQQVINTRQMVLIEDAQNNPRTSPVHDLFRAQGIESFILLPLVVNDEVIGTVGLDVLDQRSIPIASLQLAETIVYQAATAVQNARLFDQTQAALAETEMLYSYSSRLNTATSLEAALEAAAAPGFQVGATAARLLVYDQETNGRPDNGTILAALPKNKDLEETPLRLSDQPFRDLWPVSGKSALLIGDIDRDERLGEAEKIAFKEMAVRALAIMYLTVGHHRLGQIMVYWDNPQTFTGTDERLFGAIAAQASSVVYNRLLFNQTEEALSETAALYQASTDLNIAQTFDQILKALRQHTILGQNSNDVALNYFSQTWEANRPPKEVEVLARWTLLPEPGPNRYRLSEFPEAVAALRAGKIILYDDVDTDERLSEETRAAFSKRYRAKSLILVPLAVGGQRVGFISGTYVQPMRFPDAQIRRLDVLARQAVVTIQSIRLFEQTQAALAETESLYLGSEHIVMSNSEGDILQALIQSTLLQNMDRVNIFLFDEPIEDGVPKDLTAVAIWENEGVPRTVEAGTRFTVEQVPFVAQLKPDASVIIQDIREDTRIDDQTQAVLESFGMRSFILFPLVAGSQWLGVASGQSAVPTTVDETQARRAISLVNQAAMVLQSTMLIRQEQARARREHLLREIAAKLHSSSDIDTIMRTAVSEIGRTLGRRSFITLDNSQDENGVGL